MSDSKYFRKPALVAATALMTFALSTAASAQDGAFADLRSGSGSMTSAQAKQAAKLQFAKLDANHDGAVSETEFVNARMQMFRAADSNGDGQVTRAEARALLTSRAVR